MPDSRRDREDLLEAAACLIFDTKDNWRDGIFGGGTSVCRGPGDRRQLSPAEALGLGRARAMREVVTMRKNHPLLEAAAEKTHPYPPDPVRPLNTTDSTQQAFLLSSKCISPFWALFCCGFCRELFP